MNLRNWIMAGTLLASPTAPAAPDAQTLVNEASAAAYYQGQDGRAQVAMTIEDAQGRTRQRRFSMLRLDLGDEANGEQRFYVYFNRPADVSGTSFLVWKHVEAEDDRWLYLPALDLVKRIAAADERSSFVGSHFFYEDVSGRGTQEDHHEFIEETDNYFIVESRPRAPEQVAFARYRSFIHKATKLPIKIDYYKADQDSPYRSYQALKVDHIEGKPTVTAAEMTDQDMGGKTRLDYTSVSYDQGLNSNLFSERYLRNPPRDELR